MEANIPVIRLWCACQTQWRENGLGLDYNAMYRVAETLEIHITEQILRGIRLLENESVTYLQSKRPQT